jgi:uroporphyrinogen-III decarboxylase
MSLKRDILASGSPQAVAQAAGRGLSENAGNPFFILSAGGGVSPGTAADNIDALVQAAGSWKYPASTC